MANYKSTDTIEKYVVGDTVEFDYTGDIDEFQPINATKIKIEAYGAQGGGVDGIVTGGLGAYAVGELDYPVMSGKFPQGIMVKVGGAPSKSTVTVGKTNYQIANLPAVIGGGGSGIDNKGCAGGGASDVRAVMPDGTADATDADSIASRIIVAGAGAGASYTVSKGLDYDTNGAVINLEYYQKKYASYLANPPSAEYDSARRSAFMLPDKWLAVIELGDQYVNPNNKWNNGSATGSNLLVVGLTAAKGENTGIFSGVDLLQYFDMNNYICLGSFPANTNAAFFNLTANNYIQSSPFTIYARKEYSPGSRKLITDQAYYNSEMDELFISSSSGSSSNGHNYPALPNRWNSTMRASQGTVLLDQTTYDNMWSEINRTTYNLGPMETTAPGTYVKATFPVPATAEYENWADPQFGEDKIKSGIQGGNGGNFYGSVSSATSSGATQTNGGTRFGGDPANNGSLETGGSPTANFKGGGGGGGYYGGASGDPATGGNSFASGDSQCPTIPKQGITLTNTSSSPGVNSGNGKVIFTVLEIAAPIPISPPPPNPKVNHKLCIRKNGIIQKASLYANPIKQPRMAVRNGSVINYAVLSKKKTQGSIDLTCIKNGVQYWVQITGDPDYTFSLDNKGFKDGGSFPTYPSPRYWSNRWRPGGAAGNFDYPYKLGDIKVDIESTFKFEVQYTYYSNEPRGGTDAIALMVGDANPATPYAYPNSVIGNVIWAEGQDSGHQYYTFTATFNYTFKPGQYFLIFTGYKPKWHSMENCRGTVKLYML